MPYEPYVDGLFTYCLSVLCDHDAAVAALGEALALADRDRARLRDRELLRPWLYSLARYACLRRLALPPAGPAYWGAAAVPPPPFAGAADAGARDGGTLAERRRAELAALAWPEAAGTTPDQREALELAVRHGLSPREVAAVLGLDPGQTRTLLSRAAAEVERTRVAVAVVREGDCPALAGLPANPAVLLGSSLREELVRHVAECGRCRGTAQRQAAAGPGEATSDVLALVPTPRASVLTAMAVAGDRGAASRIARGGAAPAGRTRSGWSDGVSNRGAGPRQPSGRAVEPRFDRRGFPVGVREPGLLGVLLRHRVLTTALVAAVIAAPALLLWAERGEEEAATSGQGRPATASGEGLPADEGTPRSDGGPTGVARDGRPAGDRSTTASPSRPPASSSAFPEEEPRSSAGPSTAGPWPSGSASEPAPSSPPEPGRLTVSAQTQGEDTVVALSVSGETEVRWQATTDADWLALSQGSGTLRPGEQTTVTIWVIGDRQPSGPWSAQVLFQPSGTAVAVQGTGPTGSPSPSDPPSASGERFAVAPSATTEPP